MLQPAAGIDVTSKTYHVTKARRTWNRNNSHSFVLASTQIRNTADSTFLRDRERGRDMESDRGMWRKEKFVILKHPL